MTDEVVTVGADGTVQAAVETMVREGIGSVVVTRDGKPAGIVTEREVVRAGAATDAAPSAIRIARAARTPLDTISPYEPIQTAVKRMKHRRIKRLVVIDGMELAGIITTSDVIRHYDGLVREARHGQATREEWES